MKAVKVLVFLAGAGIAAGVLLANITTPALQSYRAARPAHHSEIADQSEAMVDNRPQQSNLSGQDYGYSGQNFDNQSDESRGYADDESDDNDDQGSFGTPRWLIGPERWLEQRGWIVLPSPQRADNGDHWGRGRWQQDDSDRGHYRGDDEGGDTWQDDGSQGRQSYPAQSPSAPRRFTSAPSAALPDNQPGQSAFDRAFGSSPSQSAPSGQGTSGQATSGRAATGAGDAANDAATRARDAAADVLAAEGRTHPQPH